MFKFMWLKFETEDFRLSFGEFRTALAARTWMKKIPTNIKIFHQLFYEAWE